MDDGNLVGLIVDRAKEMREELQAEMAQLPEQLTQLDFQMKGTETAIAPLSRRLSIPLWITLSW